MTSNTNEVIGVMKFIKKILIGLAICSTFVFAKEGTTTYSYGVHDFLVDGDSVIGINGGIHHHSAISVDTIHNASFYAYVEYDPNEHDPDHIPVWFQGDYHLTHTLFTIARSFRFNTGADILWKMNTESSVEQNLKTSFGIGLQYLSEHIDTSIKVGGGAYYMEFDDDVPEKRGFSRDELSDGLVLSVMHGVDFNYIFNDQLSCGASYAIWNEKNTVLEKNLSFHMRYQKEGGLIILLDIDGTKYNLDKHKKGNVDILPWNSDIVVKLSTEIPFFSFKLF